MLCHEVCTPSSFVYLFHDLPPDLREDHLTPFALHPLHLHLNAVTLKIPQGRRRLLKSKFKKKILRLCSTKDYTILGISAGQLSASHWKDLKKRVFFLIFKEYTCYSNCPGQSGSFPKTFGTECKSLKRLLTSFSNTQPMEQITFRSFFIPQYEGLQFGVTSSFKMNCTPWEQLNLGNSLLQPWVPFWSSMTFQKIFF